MKVYKVIFDVGKPYEEIFKGEENLYNGFKDFYNKNINDVENSHIEVLVYNKNVDITENKFINNIIKEILEGNNYKQYLHNKKMVGFK